MQIGLGVLGLLVVLRVLAFFTPRTWWESNGEDDSRRQSQRIAGPTDPDGG